MAMAPSSTNITNLRDGFTNRLSRFHRKLHDRVGGADSQKFHAAPSTVAGPSVLSYQGNTENIPLPDSANNAAQAQTNQSSLTTSQPNAVVHDDQTATLAEDLWSAAYREAVESLGKDTDVAILKGSSAAQLYKNLEEIDKDASQDSAFLRGVALLRSIKVPLERFKIALDLTSPLSNLEPIAGTVFGVVKGVTAIAITFASADLQFAKQIGEMLGQLSYIDDCDTLGQKCSRGDIHRALVPVYQKVLEFYQVAHEMLTRRGAKLVLKMVLETDRLPSVVQDFLKNADALRKLIEKATLEVAEDIKIMLYDHDIDRWLGSTKVSLQSRYHAELQEIRTDEACTFLLEHPNFETWYDALGSAWLIVFGDMGHGKTVAMSFIIDELRQRSNHQIPQPKICYHYCRNDETGRADHIFAALILALLQQLVGLKKTFHVWYKERQASGIQDPVQSTRELGKFLDMVLQTLDRPLFVVIDGLDECSRASREALFKSLRAFSQTTSRLKVMVASRPERQIMEQLHDVPRIDLDSNEGRDGLIVRCLVENQLSYLPEEVSTLVSEYLSRMARGSAIWTKMAVNLIKTRRIEAMEPMRRFLREISMPDQLSRLYLSMVDRYSDGDPENKKTATIALKILAVTRRPLSIQELGWAVGLASARKNVSSIANLALLVDYHRVINLIHPFIAHADLNDLEKRQIRLVHQSVKEFVVQKWHLLQDSSTIEATTHFLESERVEALECFILEICIDYLLLDEIGSVPLFSETQIAIDELPQEVDLFGDIQLSEYDPSSTWEAWEEHMIRYDPAERGFGHLFVYAASQWLQHLGAVGNRNLPSLSKIVNLCRAGSIRLQNWIAQNRRPDCVIKARFEFDSQLYDPLGILSLYGSDAMLHEMLEHSSIDDGFLPASAIAAADQILQWGDLSRLRVLFLEPKFVCQLQSLGFFELVLWRWSDINVRHDDWSVVFDLVVLVSHTLAREQWGGELLCMAARTGCTPIVQHLLDAAQDNLELKNELLHGSQAIAQAVLGDHVDVVESLLDQEGFEVHLEYLSSDSENVLHLASKTCNPVMFRLLVPRLQQSIHQKDRQGYTVLARVIESHATFQRRYESAKTLLPPQTSSDHVSYSADAHNPLKVAVLLGDTQMCQLLINDGNLDPNLVLTRDIDGSLMLKHNPPANEEAITKLLREAAAARKNANM